MNNSKQTSINDPFSHLHPSLLTPDDITCLVQTSNVDGDHSYDRYGFKIVRSTISKDDRSDSTELDEAQWYTETKSQWISFLESEYRRMAPSSCLDLSQFDSTEIERLPRLNELICLSISDELRPFFWIRFSRALHLKIASKWSFPQLIDLSASEPSLSVHQAAQVLPNNACFTLNSVSNRLRRILQIVHWYQKTDLAHNDNNGDQQFNLSLIGAYLLLICSEEDAFWLLLQITLSVNLDDCIELIGQIMTKCCPIVNTLLRKHEIEFKLVASIWFSSLLAGFVTNAFLLYALWDLYFYEGPVFLIQITIGLLITETRSLESCQDSKEFFNTLSDLPLNSLRSLDKIVYVWKSGKNIVANINLPGKLYNYENQSNADQLLGSIVANQDIKQDELKMKNIKQTALIMKLHEAIVAIGHHFQAYEPDAHYRLDPDYDNVDKVDIKQDMMNRLRPYQHRAKALIDFSSDDPDELAFAKNDIITIINEKDEHCWIGQLNDRFGWFPAKFVELLDERDQDYSIAGDDRVVPFINDLVRGKLSSALKAILAYDLRKSFFLTIHPWTIIEQISTMTTNAGFKSVFSRLVLTKTFRLDEYSRVLSPNDLLYRSIALINRTHNDCPMDIKLRSLICLGLNQYVLHDWFELICVSQPSIIFKSYGSNSFLTSPAWKLIKAELKLLVQFSFHLNIDAEIPNGHEPKSPVTKEGVCDMLVKYHLFSWDI
ncbi:Small G protein signaling modulator 3 [Dermatophagoides farinae]|uniref:RUN and TBC1 domain-containing protein 3 n=1 Tax=Dermatophagoides farinae TaxID=6954 RepID=A0A922I6V6_DERFA|nr:Small G protein signaling modulator 3 [Dermatophagoides farinae]